MSFDINKFKNPHLKNFSEYQSLYENSIQDPSNFFLKQAHKELDWFSIPKKGFSGKFKEPSWFEDGKLNITYNCIDRHLKTTPDKTAIIWQGDEEKDFEYISFRKLLLEVSKLANGLKQIGVQKGDRVCIYMPMIPQAAYAMLACLRIGAVHSVVFGGFSPEAIKTRIIDSNC